MVYVRCTTKLANFAQKKEMEPIKRGAAAKHWVFTINNPSDEDRAHLDMLSTSSDCAGMIFQKEVGEAGTPHYQGYVALTRKMRRTQLSKLLPRAWLDVCKSPKDAIEYCRKGETRVEGPWEFGDLNVVTKGKRSDLLAVRDTLRTGEFNMDVLHEEHFAVLVKYASNLQSVINHYVPDRNERTKLHIYYGPPGTGKTFCAMHYYDPPLEFANPPMNPRTFKMNVNRTDPWFDGYDPMQHDIVVFDEYKGTIDHDKILQLIDEYPTMVERKGGFVKWRPKHVIMTMNSEPFLLYRKTWAKSKHAYDAFWRRVTTLTCMLGFENNQWIQHDVAEYAKEHYDVTVAHVDAEERSYRKAQPTHEPAIVHTPAVPKRKRASKPPPELPTGQRTIDDYQ